MLRSINHVWRTLRRDENGNIVVLFGATAIPLLLILGGAVDFARYNRYKTELANAVDSGALALARRIDDYVAACPEPDEGDPGVYCEPASDDLAEFVTTFGIPDDKFSVGEIRADRVHGGFLVAADGEMETVFLPLGNLTNTGTQIMTMDMNIVAEVRESSNRLELALVLDNTGSMNCGDSGIGSCVLNWSNPGSSSRIFALKEAAHTLIDTLMTDEDNPMIKVALVPFEGDVNIGQTYVDQAYAGNPPAWLDWSNVAQAKYNGRNFGKYDFSTNAACTTGASCSFVGHKWLYNNLTTDNTNVKWAGCVEMRAEPHDILDTEPTSATPDTLFVPRLWPDEPDSDNDDGDTYQNDYLDDITSNNGSTAQRYVQKYYTSNIDWHSTPDTTFPYERGPNFGCPRPIVPLTMDKATVEAAIDGMVAYWSTGTFIPTGLVWGWHVLSPTEPFTDGLAPGDQYYDQTVKAIVLLTDGDNVVSQTNNHNYSRFSGYNYTGMNVGGTYRLGSSNVSTAINNLNTKTADLCENAKDAGIRLYTIVFGDVSANTETLMRDCATEDDGDPLYYHAPTTTDLQDIFREIGEDLSAIHLAM